MFAILAAHFGPRPQAPEVITAATVVEMIHLATLYHDDVMDEAPVRRAGTVGELSLGQPIAILSGDFPCPRLAPGVDAGARSRC